MAIHREGGVAHHSGTISEVSSDWYKTFSLFKRVSIGGKPIRGFMYCRRTDVWDVGHVLTSRDYATKKELFQLKLKGKE